jgi:hypothetical protein
MKPKAHQIVVVEYEQFGGESPLLASGDSTVRPGIGKFCVSTRYYTN